MADIAELKLAVFAEITEILKATKAKRIVCAYSGGLDSSVLLHLLADFVHWQPAYSLVAVHINHNISPSANLWEEHCKSVTSELNIPLVIKNVEIKSKSNLEATARAYRYDAFKEILDAQSVLFTAHHRKDQAETLLLNLLRGTGTTGLAGILQITRLQPGWLARPLLDIAREQLVEYARNNHLTWQEDESNEDTHYARNYLRHHITPLFSQRWPQWEESFARACGHHSMVRRLTENESTRWLGRCLIKRKQLSRKAVRALPEEYRNLVLREWIKLYGLVPPNSRKLALIWSHLIERDARHGSAIVWSNMEIRFYRGLLYLIPLPRMQAPTETIHWQAGSNINLPDIGITLAWNDLMRQVPDLKDSDVDLCFRSDNHNNSHCRHKLKKWFQESGIPPWEREYIPLIYDNNRLRLIWNVKVCN